MYWIVDLLWQARVGSKQKEALDADAGEAAGGTCWRSPETVFDAPTATGNGSYTISIEGERCRVHPQTLRLKEWESLVQQSPTEGNTRMYINQDTERLDVRLGLVRSLSVNLRDGQIILKARAKNGCRLVPHARVRQVGERLDSMGVRRREPAHRP